MKLLLNIVFLLASLLLISCLSSCATTKSSYEDRVLQERTSGNGGLDVLDKSFYGLENKL